MKFFSFFLSFIACGLNHEFTLNNLIYSYGKVRQLYLKQIDDGSFTARYKGTRKQLKKFLLQCYQNCPVELFQKVEYHHDFQLAHAVIGTVNSLILNQRSSPVWVEHLLRDMSPTMFFDRAKKLIRIIVERKDWLTAKEILRVLLRIQKQFLHKLDYNEFPKVKARLEGYQFIHDWYDPNDKKIFIDLFRHFHLLATKHKGTVPTGSSVRKSFKLFNLYRFHSFNHNIWKQFEDVSKIPRKLVFIMLVPSYSISRVFQFFNRPSPSQIPDLFRLSLYFSVVTAYIGKVKEGFISMDHLRRSPHFSEFMRSCIKSPNEYHKILGKIDFWLIEAYFHVLSIFWK
jgi:hypothetical protein